ncbi:MAG: hypothetical protein Q9182_000706 [Xanthomendoza sp. 2 TL-2023]
MAPHLKCSRLFSTCRGLQAPGEKNFVAAHEKPQKSMKLLMKQDAGVNLPMDLGLLEGTFIMPTGRRKPSLFLEPQLRMGWSYKYLSKKKPRPKMGLRRVGPTAQALYRQMVAVLPYKGSAIRQVVIRMRSHQSLARLVSGGPGRPEALVQGTGEKKPVSEYLVLQRRMWKEVEEPWMVWGTTEETEPDTVLGSNAVMPAMSKTK